MDVTTSLKGEDPVPLDRDQFGTAIAALNDIQDTCRQIVKEQMKITQRTSKAYVTTNAPTSNPMHNYL